MVFRRGLILFVVSVTCVSSTLTGTQCAYSQALPVTQHEQNAPSGTQAAKTSSVSVNDEEFPKEWPLALNILYYEHFLSWVGEEDTRIHEETLASKEQNSPWVDYASAIGITKDEEQAMLAILVDAYRKSEENRTQYKQADDQLLATPGVATDLALHAHLLRAMLKANRVILDDAYIKLKESLGQEDFKKLDQYVDREFAITTYPASLRGQMMIFPTHGQEPANPTEAGRVDASRADANQAALDQAQANKDLVRNLFQAYEQGDVNLPNNLFAPIAIIHSNGEEFIQGSPIGSLDLTSRCPLCAELRDRKITIDRIVAGDDWVAVWSTWSGKFSGTLHGITVKDKDISVNYTNFYYIRDGRITQDSYKVDGLYFVKRLGADRTGIDTPHD